MLDRFGDVAVLGYLGNKEIMHSQIGGVTGHCRLPGTEDFVEAKVSLGPN